MLVGVSDQRDGPPRQRGAVLPKAQAEQGLDLVQEHVLRVVERVDRDFPEADRSCRRLEVAPGEEPLVVHVLVHRVALIDPFADAVIQAQGIEERDHVAPRRGRRKIRPFIRIICLKIRASIWLPSSNGSKKTADPPGFKTRQHSRRVFSGVSR